MKVRRIEKVLLYDEGVGSRLDIEEIAAYLRESRQSSGRDAWRCLCLVSREKSRFCGKACYDDSQKHLKGEKTAH
jgi:hypothetical protein